MFLVKLTVLAIVLTIILVFIFRVWCANNILRAYVEDYPYIITIPLASLIVLDIMGIIYSAIYLLFFH